MKNQEKDLQNENSGSTRRKLTKEELTRTKIQRVYENGRRRT